MTATALALALDHRVVALLVAPRGGVHAQRVELAGRERLVAAEDGVLAVVADGPGGGR